MFYLEEQDIWPYIMILPGSKEELIETFNSLFNSKIPLEILSLFNDNENIRLHQSKIIQNFKEHSNKSLIKHLNQLVNVKILQSGIERAKINKRNFWVRWYKLSKMGKYIQLLFKNKISEENTRKILKELFYFYISKIIEINKKYQISITELKELFDKALFDSMEG